MDRKKRSGWIWMLLCLIVAAGIAAWWVYRSGFNVGEPVSIYIDADDTVDSIAQKTEKTASMRSTAQSKSPSATTILSASRIRIRNSSLP